MSVGHGQPGLLSNLRTFSGLFDSLIQKSRARLKPFVEYQLGLPFGNALGPNPDWVVFSGSVYRMRYDSTVPSYGVPTTQDGLLRDIVGIDTGVLPQPLARVQSSAAVVAGTYFALIEAPVGPTGASRVEVFLRLPDSSNPNNTRVIFKLLWTIGAYGEIHPWMSPDLLIDGNLDVWTSPTVLTNWTPTLTTGVTLDRVAAISGKGTFAARITQAVGATGATGQIIPTALIPVIAGSMIRVSGVYSTKEGGMPSGLFAILRILKQDSALEIRSDGREEVATGAGFTNALRFIETYGMVRRFVFDWVVPAGWTSASFRPALWNSNGVTATDSAVVTFDDIKFQRIYSWNAYRPNLTSDGVPTQEISSASIMFGQKSISVGSMSIDNSDGSISKMFGQLIHINQPAQVLVGGEFSDDGQEIYRDDWHEAFPARMRLAEIGDNDGHVALENARGVAKIITPPNKYSIAENANLDDNREGDVKPHVFGDTQITSLKPVRTDFGSDLYGLYEILDPEVPNATLVGIDGGTIKSYPNEELADKDEKGLVVNNPTTEYTYDSLKTHWTIVADIRNYKYDQAGNDVGTNSIFDFNIGGAELHADLDISGSSDAVATALAARMNTVAASGTAITVVFSNSTKKFTVAKTSGTLQILPQTGLNSHKQSWKLLGFDSGINRTGALTYTGDEATFLNPEANHVLRFTSTGYKDDAAGSICGVANASINTHPAIASWLLQKVAKIPPSKIDLPSFTAARLLSVGDNQLIRAVFDQQTGLDQVLAELDIAGMMDTVVDGGGVWRCIKRETVVRRYFYDSDYLEKSFKMWHDPEQIFKLIKVLYAYHGSKKKFLKSATSATTGVKNFLDVLFGTEEVQEIRSWLIDDSTAATLLAKRIANFSRNLDDRTPRLARFDAAGKLLDLLPGHIISLTRTRSLNDTLGATLSNTTFRVLGLHVDYGNGRATCTAVENTDYTST